MIILHQFQGMVIGSQKLGFPPLSFQDSGGDPIAESHPDAEGVIGHFTIGSKGKTDLEVKRDAHISLFLRQSCIPDTQKGQPMPSIMIKQPGMLHVLSEF